MEAKTKYQKYIVGLVKGNLKPLTAPQEKWLIGKSFSFYAVKHYSNLICLECGHKWNGSFNNSKTVGCPSCKKNLHDVEYHSSGYASRDSHGVFFDQIGDVAVIRIFYIRKHMKKGEESSYTIQEVARKCFDPKNQKFTLFQRTIMGAMGNYGGGWAIGSELALRGHDDDYRTQVDGDCLIYPTKRIPEHFLKAGFHFGKDNMVNSYDKLMYVLLDPRLETLYKYKESSLLRHFMSRRNMTAKHWSALKIVFRNEYFKKNEKVSISDWLDLVNLLIEFKKDTSSPHYVFPKDFHQMHNSMVKLKRKKQKEEEKREAEKRLQEALKNQEQYIKLKEKYFGVIMEDNDLKIEVFKSIDQFKEEGDILGHCVFTNEYFNKENSLVLSAKVNGEVVETIEVSLIEMEIVQARGKGNEPSEFNDRIINLVQNNISTISNVYKNYAVAS